MIKRRLPRMRSGKFYEDKKQSKKEVSNNLNGIVTRAFVR